MHYLAKTGVKIVTKLLNIFNIKINWKLLQLIKIMN